ncbi:hypothetical protein RBSH_04410 [Rhodopirellula baltica SH28]|uniref:Uncharacterized protein n=2 Tax=Rhodopirellula baltica TaxID=265606 RepID=K5CAI6_RHOBT|nr:hypothetical protein RBSH_04410 [Rhodopirellula baltica SH28]ELP33095.1 hypothetical protein RBSWK_02941 [Rhodopirellula baltica SWK14]
MQNDRQCSAVGGDRSMPIVRPCFQCGVGSSRGGTAGDNGETAEEKVVFAGW